MLCRRCGATIHDGLRVCPHCGERQARQPSTVSCSHCHHRALAASSICPRCGHVLRARRLSGGLLTAASVVLVAGLALSVGIVSHRWNELQTTAKERLAQIGSGVSELGGKVLDTASSLAAADAELATPTPTPVVVLAALPSDANRLAPADIVLAPTTVGGAIGGGPGTSGEAIALAAPETTAEAGQAGELPTAAPTEAPTETPTKAPTATSPPPTPAPVTPTPTRVAPTPTRAAATPTRVAATPTRIAPTPTRPAPTATRVEPTPGAAAAGAAAGAATAGAGTYSVQSGDNWFSIAQHFGITQETLAAYNDSLPSDILQVDQVLRIPPAGTSLTLPTATATPVRPTATPAATATPTVPPATPTPAIVALPAPGLLLPADGDGFVTGAQPILAWRPAAGIGPQDYYYVLVRYTTRDGQTSYLEDRVTGTSYAVPLWFYDLANTPDRLGRWSVQVRRLGADGQEIEISPTSESRTFYWR